MTINKYNANNNNENGKEARGTYKPKHRYAAIAAAFTLLVGGIGGSAALGKYMDKNSKPVIAFAKDEITASAAATESAATTMAAPAETTAAVNNGHAPADMDAFAQEWLGNYNEWLRIPNGCVEHEEQSVSFKLAEGSDVPAINAWKITDKEYSSADAINEKLHDFWAPGSKDEIAPVDLTEKISNGTASYNDFLGGIYFIYNNELYSRNGYSYIEGNRTSPSAEKLNDNEILVRFTLGYEGVTEQQTMHLVWIDELNDWRVDELFFEDDCSSSTTESDEATMAAPAETTATAIAAPAETTTAVNNDHAPADMDAFAQEWLGNYNEWLRIPNGCVEHEEQSVSFKLAEGSDVPAIDAWKITDNEYSSADAINEKLHAFWAPGSKAEIAPVDLTEKISNGTASYNDFLGGIYFIYNNELYSRNGYSYIEGNRTSPSAEKLNDNEILVRFTLGYEGVTEQQTMHLVWIDELNDWRVDELFF